MRVTNIWNNNRMPLSNMNFSLDADPIMVQQSQNLVIWVEQEKPVRLQVNNEAFYGDWEELNDASGELSFRHGLPRRHMLSCTGKVFLYILLVCIFAWLLTLFILFLNGYQGLERYPYDNYSSRYSSYYTYDSYYSSWYSWISAHMFVVIVLPVLIGTPAVIWLPLLFISTSCCTDFSTFCYSKETK